MLSEKNESPKDALKSMNLKAHPLINAQIWDTSKTCIIFIILVSGIILLTLNTAHKNTARQLRLNILEIRNRQIEGSANTRLKFLKTPTFRNTQSLECLKNKRIKWTMVTFVKSKLQDFEQRALVRRTWGSVVYARGMLLHTVFVVGTDFYKSAGLKISLDNENRRHSDLLQVDVPDVYKKLGQKSLAAMQWASENLPKNYFFTNADDDMFININDMITVVKKNLRFSKFHWPDFPIICMYHKAKEEILPNRNNRSRQYVSKEKYKWPTFPQYCFGGMYTMRVNIVRDLWNLAMNSDSFDMVEDVWITGLMRQKLGLPNEMLIGPSPPIAFHHNEVHSGNMAKFVSSWYQVSLYLNLTISCQIST